MNKKLKVLFQSLYLQILKQNTLIKYKTIKSNIKEYQKQKTKVSSRSIFKQRKYMSAQSVEQVSQLLNQLEIKENDFNLNDRHEFLKFQNSKQNQVPHPIPNPHCYPLNCVGRIVCKYAIDNSTSPEDNKQTYGVGTIISPIMIITSAHFMYNRKTKQVPQEIIFYPQTQQGNQKPIKIKKHYIESRYKDENNKDYQKYNIAFLILEMNNIIKAKNICRLTQKYNFEKHKQNVITTTGYPKNKSLKNGIYYQYCQFGKNTLFCDQQYLYHNLSTQQGYSGSPLIVIEQFSYKKPKLVGIHNGTTGQQNYCTLITADTIQTITKLHVQCLSQRYPSYEYKLKQGLKYGTDESTKDLYYFGQLQCEQQINAVVVFDVNSNVYFGYMKELKRQIYGLILIQSGEMYDGQWLDDNFHGKGRIQQKQYTYIGEFKQNIKQGFGILDWIDGQHYQGQLVNDQKSGKGVFTWPDGELYQGQFKHDILCGWAHFVWADGYVYEGQFKQGKPYGQGIYVWKNDSIQQGQWVEDKQSVQGYGFQSYGDGNSYKGFFVNGLRHGDGVYVQLNSSSFKGNWYQGQRDGIFECLRKDGTIEISQWKNGVQTKIISDTKVTKISQTDPSG